MSNNGPVKENKKSWTYYFSVNRLKINEKGYFKYWFLLWNFVVSIIYKTIQNPKFIFSFLVIMLISSAGIWAPWLYSLDLSPVCNTIIPHGSSIRKVSGEVVDSAQIRAAVNVVCAFLSSQEIFLIQNFSLFMFNLGLLGGIAAEFFINKKNDLAINERNQSKENISIDSKDNRVKEYGAFFLWILAFILSFFALKNPTGESPQVIWGGVISIFLWIFTNAGRKEYEVEDVHPSNILGGEVVELEKLQGEGLEDIPETQIINEVKLNGKGLE